MITRAHDSQIRHALYIPFDAPKGSGKRITLRKRSFERSTSSENQHCGSALHIQNKRTKLIATIEMAVLRALPRPLGKTILGLDSQRNATPIMIKCSSSTEASCLPTQSLRYHFSLAFDLCSFFVSIPIYLVSL